MKSQLFIITLLIFFSTASAQNLVKNPSFEELESNSGRIDNWDVFAGDHYSFHKDKKKAPYVSLEFQKKVESRGYGVPFNFFGKQAPRTGKGYLVFSFGAVSSVFTQ